MKLFTPFGTLDLPEYEPIHSSEPSRELTQEEKTAQLKWLAKLIRDSKESNED